MPKDPNLKLITMKAATEVGLQKYYQGITKRQYNN